MLLEIARKYNVDKAELGQSGGHNYIPFYEQILRDKKESAKNVLEIGVAGGASLKMWRDYFENATIYGWDILDTSHLNEDRIKTFIIDQSNINSINNFFFKNDITFDYIIDDGSHMLKDQMISLFELFPKLTKGGIYIIEDLWHHNIDSFLKLGKKDEYIELIDPVIKSFATEDKIKFLLDNLICCQKNNVIFSSAIDKTDHHFYTFYKKIICNVGLRYNIFNKYLNEYFVETGSFNGGGISWALDSGFKNVVSIELSELYYNKCKELYKTKDNVFLYLGDSSIILGDIIRSINTPMTFWLDGHYSGGDTAIGKYNSPLMQELDIIKDHPIKTHTILIDDMRCWNDLHEFNKNDILNKLEEINKDYEITYEDGFIDKDILVAKINNKNVL